MTLSTQQTTFSFPRNGSQLSWICCFRRRRGINRFSMELKRRVRDMISFVLLISSTATALSGQSLDCTNDYEKVMFCHFEAQNCAEYNLTLQSNDGDGEEHCIFKQCDVVGRCCCSFDNMMLVQGETHTATIWKGGHGIESEIIDVKGSVKPKTPTITSVRESNGNFQVKWKTNMGFLSSYLTANVTYHKKGDTEMVSEYVKQTAIDGLNYYEISGGQLEPSTTYAVSVKSYTDWSDKFSDSSEEWEFTTAMSLNTLASVIIISLCFAAVIISGTIYGCYVKLKAKWWDTVAKCPNPKLLIMHSSEQEVLKPDSTIISSVLSVEPRVADDSKPWSTGSLKDISSGSPQQSSGISTGSSCLSYANTEPADILADVQDALDKALANIIPTSPLTTNSLTELIKGSDLLSAPYNPCGVRADDMSSGSSDFVNKTYFILLPSCQHPIVTDSSEVQTESAYHLTCVDQQAPACSLPVVMATDKSYQQCNADSGGSSCAGDSSLSSISCDTNIVMACDPVSRVEVVCESFDEAVFDEATKLHGKTEGACEENPCYSGVTAGSSSFPPVVDDYQAFQNLVEQPDILLSEERSGEKEEHLKKYLDESFTKMPQSFFSPVAPGFMNSAQGGQCLSELQTPFLSLIPAVDQSMPLITDSGYQSV